MIGGGVDQLVEYFVGAGVTAAIALLWKVDRAIARHNGALSHVMQEQARVAAALLAENGHVAEITLGKIDSVRDEQRRVADALLAAVLTKVGT